MCRRASLNRNAPTLACHPRDREDPGRHATVPSLRRSPPAAAPQVRNGAHGVLDARVREHDKSGRASERGCMCLTAASPANPARHGTARWKRQRIAAADHVRGLFADHDRRRVEIARRDRRHDRGVDDAQPLEPDHARLSVDDRRGIVARAHLARAARVIGALDLFADEGVDRLVVDAIGAGLDFAAAIGIERALARKSRASAARRRASRVQSSGSLI